MNPERWREVRAVFENALDVPAAERQAFVDCECHGDADLLAQVGELLATDTATDGSKILDRTPATDALPTFCPPLAAGDRVASYSIRHTIGSGGMGTVYEAEQDSPSRTVAIKVMHQGLRSTTALRRFQFESEILARLRHPGIAQVYESGTFIPPGTRAEAAEVPFFAMECVEGARDLATYVEEEQLSRLDRIELLREVCDAVHYGHLQGVVHRDLKPANILVDRHRRVKIIDFGIATMKSAGGSAKTELTRDGQLLGTINYASPEQVEGRGDTVDARADVYSLGVIAFQLLSGELPHRLDDTTLARAARIVVEEDAPALGARDRSLAGDLETVVAKALQKDPEHRYQSASELSLDLASYLDHRPVLARPPSAWYQLRKLARRHRAPFAVALVAGLFLVASFGVVIAQNIRIRAEQGRTARVSSFLRGIIAEADAMQRGKDFTMREALDEAALRIDGKFASDPDLEAEIRHVVGDTYLRLSVLDAAESHLERAWSLRRELFGPDAPVVIETQAALASLRWSQDRSAEAVELVRHCFDVRRREDGERDSQTLRAMHNLGQYLKSDGRIAEAEQVYRRALELRNEVFGEDSRDALSTKHNLGKLLLDDGYHTKARPILEQVLAARERVFGPDDLETLLSLDVLGLMARGSGDLVASERAHRRARVGFAAQLGEDHEHTLAASMHLVWTLLTAGRNKAAWEVAEPTLARCRAVLGTDHSHTLRVMRMAAAAAASIGANESAGELFEAALQASIGRHGAGHRGSIRAAHDFAFWLHREQRGEEAIEVLRAAVVVADPSDPDTEVLVAAGQMTEGIVLIGLERYEDAERVLLASLETHRAHQGPHSEATSASLRVLVQLYEAWQRPEELRRWRRERDAVIEARSGRAVGR